MSVQETIVQFSAAVYFVEETEEAMTIDLIRLGNHNCVSTVSFHTVDASARAGLKYEHTEGVVTFKVKEYMHTIKVPIVQDETWSPTLEFKVVLHDPEGCILVPDGSTCRVKIIDDDVFPSNKYRAAIAEKRLDSISQWGLFVEFVKLNLTSPGTKVRTLASIVFDQMHNLYLFFLLKAKTYLVNVVFNTQDASTSSQLIFLGPLNGGSDMESRVDAARLVAVMYVLPMLALHVWDYIKLQLDVEGHSRVFLQTCIFRKYLNYTEASRSVVRVSHMQVALLNNTTDLAKAYCSVLEMVKMVGKLILLVVFMLTQDSQAAWVLAVMPTMMLFWGILRNKSLSLASEMSGPLKKVLIDITTETCAKYRLIADYAQRPQMNDLFQRRAEELRRSLVPESQVELNNNYFPKWLGPCFSAAYIAFYAEPVLRGELTLGVFLATLSVFSEVSGDFASLYEHIMDINSRLDSLQTLTKYFNMETEVVALKHMSRARRQATKAAWVEALKKPPPPAELGLLRSDLIPISLQKLSFSYPPSSVFKMKTAFSLQDVSLNVAQGQMVAIVGPHGSGKGTFLRLLSQTIFPTDGAVLVPMHLRVLFVQQLPVLFDRDPFYNIVFGRPDFKDPYILEALLKELEMDTTLELLRAKLDALKGRRSSKVRASLHGRGSVKASPTRSRELAVAPAGAPRQGAPDSRTRGDYVELVELENSRDDDDDDSTIEESSSSDEERGGLLRSCCSAAAAARLGAAERVQLDDGHGWQDMLSYTEQVKICLLRALLMNPEVLILHRPFHNYDIYTQQKVLALLKHHRDNRGLGLPKSTWNQRRPRTIFFTPESVEQAQAADIIWQIDSENQQVVEISAEEVKVGFRFHEERRRNLRQQWQGQAVRDHDQQVASGTFALSRG